MKNRFAQFNQQELEIIEMALTNLSADNFCHKDAQVDAREALFQEVVKETRAANTDTGSHFGTRR